MLLSMVVAPTVSSQGASLERVRADGPLFPAAQLTKMPFSTALKPPMATGLASKLLDGPPRDSDATWIPSLMAVSRPARISLLGQPLEPHTL
ncbi:unnamed protein product [Spirodela intermedia]|uniref:Uncharacterized protein n=1 Tax=Spirodela intermedia TaxID=51605 RepID=A0A7I8L8W9_SPIIN|nr:unnamed protein product [Spirodela intermedia]